MKAAVVNIYKEQNKVSFYEGNMHKIEVPAD